MAHLYREECTECTQAKREGALIQCGPKFHEIMSNLVLGDALIMQMCLPAVDSSNEQKQMQNFKVQLG